MKRYLLILLLLFTFSVSSCNKNEDVMKPIDEHFHAFTNKECNCGYKFVSKQLELGDKVDFGTLLGEFQISSFDTEETIFKLVQEKSNYLPLVYDIHTNISLDEENFEIAGTVYNGSRENIDYIYFDAVSHFTSADNTHLYGQLKSKYNLDNHSVFNYFADEKGILAAYKIINDEKNYNAFTLENGITTLNSDYRQLNNSFVQQLHNLALKNLINNSQYSGFEEYYQYSYEIYENYLVLTETNPFGYYYESIGKDLNIILQLAVNGHTTFTRKSFVNLKTGTIDYMEVSGNIVTFDYVYLGKVVNFSINFQTSSQTKEEFLTKKDQLLAFLDKYAIYEKK